MVIAASHENAGKIMKNRENAYIYLQKAVKSHER